MASSSSSTSRSSSLLVGLLLLSGLCMTSTVTATRSLQETSNKLALAALPLDVKHLLDTVLQSEGGLLRLAIEVDLSGVLHPVQLLLEDATGKLVLLDAVEGVVTELEEPVVVKVKDSDGTLTVVVKAFGKKLVVPVKLSELVPVVERVGDLEVVHVVLKLVETVEKKVNVVLKVVGAVTGTLLGLITAIL